MIGAGIGALAGAGVGIKAGAKKAAPILEQAKDVYVSAKNDLALENLAKINAKTAVINRTLAKVTEKAKEDFPKMSKGKIGEFSQKASELIKKAKNTKIKWIAVGVAAGVAAGALIGKLINSKKADKTEQQG